jgi:hypothetical protein
MANWNTSYNVGNLRCITPFVLCAGQNHTTPSSPPSHTFEPALSIPPKDSHSSALTTHACSQISAFEATINTSPKKKVSSHGRVMLQLAQDVIKPSSIVRLELGDAAHADGIPSMFCSKKPRSRSIAIYARNRASTLALTKTQIPIPESRGHEENAHARPSNP